MSLKGLTVFLGCICICSAQLSLWAWIGGFPDNSTYTPSGRQNGGVWYHSLGLFLFGGYQDGGYRNDLWLFTSGLWYWQGGSTSTNQPGVLGTQGTPSTSNIPAARSNFGTWESNGITYLFGGSSVNGSFNELWAFQPVQKTWTWINGSNTDRSIYGSQGVASSGNWPPRRDSLATWSTPNALYLFGGRDTTRTPFKVFNDLWMFSLVNAQWTWISGSNRTDQTGFYGVQGTPDPRNSPGARYSATSWIIAGSDRLYLFGGRYPDDTGAFNDLWTYSLSSGLWTWLSGNNGSGNAWGSYGTRGVPSATNVPGARSSCSSWVTTNALYLFGGVWNAVYNDDLWKYDVASGMWVWIGGRQNSNQPGVYGPQGTFGMNLPGSRSASMTWQTSDTMYTFGGYGYSTSANPSNLN
eukprot:TRINITY_DN3527_c0_g2_i3.p1 TRINITY_DN3527_c0_g2~~TRINITY_DN3527_c0_g2_i3.p1  ORF type:complete len:410 (-),score=28.19 TRINITY_DN3527_c0_g2_i3:105-1334(-)